MRFSILVALSCLPSIAFAQMPPQPPPAPEQQVLGARLMQEMNNSIACDVDRVKLNARIKELEAQLLPKKDKPEKK